MKKLLLVCFAICVANISIGQVTNEGVPKSWKNLESSKAKSKILPSFDLESIKAEDAINEQDRDNPKPWRFGYMHSVDYGLQDGTWDTLENGDRVWRIAIESPGAISLNFIFDEFYMPEGASVYLYSDDRKDLLGAYTAVQNQESGILGTWLVKGEKVWIEYFEPLAVQGQGKLHIAKATHGYRSSGAFANNTTKALNDSGDCNLDVDCSIGDDWELFKNHNKKSIGILLSGGNGFCSGALINNTSNDGTPYFLTANHCFSNPAAWSFRFGWISPTPVCASTDNSEAGPEDMTISGGTLRARNADSDFCLVEINSDIPEDWDRVWAGWDKTDNFPEFQVGIHHPSGDVMKVCRDDTPAIKAIHDAGGGPQDEAETWEITSAGGGWELGVTEGGSSGSPLFDQNGRIIGQLFGGGAACSGTNDNNALDFYGRFGISWDGPTAATRLRDWLDPTETDPDVLDSFPVLETFEFDGTVSVAIPELECGNTTTAPIITLNNQGSQDITSATLTWNLDGGNEETIEFTGTLGQFESEDITLDPIDFSTGMHEVNVTLVSINGDADQNADNNSATGEINVEAELITTQVHLELTTDDYAEETSWEFRNIDGTIIASFGPYQQTTDDNTTFTYDFDVDPNECYEFEIFDAFGDGICCQFGNGSYELTIDDETVIFSGGEFGDSEITQAAIGEPLSVGDVFSDNFSLYPNPVANVLNITMSTITPEVNYAIVNIVGQQIQKGTLSTGTTELSTEKLTPGIYFITIEDTVNNTRFTEKLIKK
ncbi:T9SS type A sorting domain-containing protein [uncultured Dokdonia sp.]|uniref:T9SS type A sorting domain-containing protein n=1 Tax=uncultured Dokdonia sp. TaxID=575653 RepID=UPI002612430E|nr:T9SS type A sorting domain-containing protein [uncultured Dokdonia sp.]